MVSLLQKVFVRNLEDIFLVNFRLIKGQKAIFPSPIVGVTQTMRGCVAFATRAFATPIFVASATPIFVASATPYFRTFATRTAATPKNFFNFSFV